MKKLLTAVAAAALGLLPHLAAAQATIPMPLGPATLEQIIGRVIKVLLSLSGTLALVMIIVAGFRWMTAQGEVDQVKKAKATLTWSIIGLIVAFSSYAMVDFILQRL
jgi:type IV secretory pathway VirB2 component (pilin)